MWRLPDSYLCFSPPDRAPEVGPLPALANGHVTFGSFNNTDKLSRATLALWARVLEAVPDSRLLLKNKPLEKRDVADAILAGQRQGAPILSRVVLLGFVKDPGGHLGPTTGPILASIPSPTTARRRPAKRSGWACQ